MPAFASAWIISSRPDFANWRSEHRRAALGLFVSLDRTVFAIFGAEHHTIHACFRQCLDHLLAPGLRQLVGKEPAIPDYDAHRHFLFRHINPSSMNTSN